MCSNYTLLSTNMRSAEYLSPSVAARFPRLILLPGQLEGKVWQTPPTARLGSGRPPYNAYYRANFSVPRHIQTTNQMRGRRRLNVRCGQVKS